MRFMLGYLSASQAPLAFFFGLKSALNYSNAFVVQNFNVLVMPRYFVRAPIRFRCKIKDGRTPPILLHGKIHQLCIIKPFSFKKGGIICNRVIRIKSIDKNFNIFHWRLQKQKPQALSNPGGHTDCSAWGWFCIKKNLRMVSSQEIFHFFLVSP